MTNDISVVMLGAGKSLRFNSKTIKQNYKINNKSILNYSRDFFKKHFSNSQSYLVINEKVKIDKLCKNENIIMGSSTRTKSLNNCLKYIYDNNLKTKYTLVHDVARPILNIFDIKLLIEEMKRNYDGSSLGYPITNALKEVRKGVVQNNILRDNLWSSFTPQIFKTEKLNQSVKSCISNSYDVDDDIESLLLNNLRCSMIISSPTNIKITYMSDIDHIKRIL